MEYNDYIQKYESGNITLYQADCMKMLPQIPDNYYSLCICDPPYGIGINSMNMGGRQTIKPNGRIWDNEKPSLIYFIQLQRISSNQIVWGANNFIKCFPSDMMDSRCWIVWDKGETMYGRSFADCELAWTSFDSSASLFKHNPMQISRIHPTQKPVKLYEWLLKNYAKKGDKILDTHGGSMSIAIACYNLDFDLTLFELDEDYYKAGVARFEEHKKQQRLFP